MGRYIGTTDLRQYLSPDNSLSTEQDGFLGSCIRRVEASIDAHTRRTFVGTAGTAFYSRFFQDRVRNNAFYLDQDLFSLSALTLGDGQSVPVGSVWLEPRNVGPPYRILRLKSTYVYGWNTDQDMQVVGTWGYGTVPPDDIIQAAIRWSAYVYRQKDVGPGDVVGFPEGGEVQVLKGMPDDVKHILNRYTSKTGGAI